MKYSKLLKSAILSTALLSMGAAQAQTSDGATKLSIESSALTITAGEVNFGRFLRGTAASTVTLVCNNNGAATTTSTPDININPGACGRVEISSVSASSTAFRVSVTATTMSGPSSASLVAPTMQTYTLAGTGFGSASDQTVTQANALIIFIGGTVNVGANPVVGEYTGTYTFTATIQ